MKNISIWQDNIKFKKYPKLSKDIDVDVLIIGGGITGISTLYHLRDTKLKVVLVEQEKVAMSVTSRSTGKLSFLQNDLLDKIRLSGDDVLKEYLLSQIEAIKLTVSIIKEEKIDCNLEKVNSILYTNNPKEIDDIKDLKRFLELCNIKVNETNNNLVKSKYMIEVNNTYLFHPVKFVTGLASKLSNIYEDTSIKKIVKENDYYICYTDKYKIKTKYVVLASHYPYFLFPYLFPLKASLEKSYLTSFKYQCPKTSLISYSKPFISIRTYQDNLIYLSNSHSINSNTCDKKHFNELLKKVEGLSNQVDYLWSNSDIITSDGLPLIGEISDNMIIATGYNTWGLANGVLAGKLIKNIIFKKNSRYLTLFDPRRDNLQKTIGNFTNSYKSISGYITGIINSKNKINCPHMGCRLIYNEVENTYDCPCHGSRFTKDGKVIISPSNSNLKYK